MGGRAAEPFPRANADSSHCRTATGACGDQYDHAARTRSFQSCPRVKIETWRGSDFRLLKESSAHRILPLTVAIAREVSVLQPVLLDPVDCVIVATARVHGLRLLTSDQRILNSNLVSTVD
jgi:hypothetical protein